MSKDDLNLIQEMQQFLSPQSTSTQVSSKYQFIPVQPDYYIIIFSINWEKPTRQAAISVLYLLHVYVVLLLHVCTYFI